VDRRTWPGWFIDHGKRSGASTTCWSSASSQCIFSFLFPFLLIANLGQAAVLYFGGRQIIDDTLTLGDGRSSASLSSSMGQLGFIIPDGPGRGQHLQFWTQRTTLNKLGAVT
jgi:hypothetical protein